MKTTVNLPDETLQRAKIFAAKNSTTLKEVITEALEKHLTEPDRNQERQRKTHLKRLLKQMQASNSTPMKPLTREEIYDR